MGKVSKLLLVKVSKIVGFDKVLLIYLPKKVVETLGVRKGDEVRLLLDLEANRLLVEKNEAV
jgi:hypothetical protein